MSPNEPASPQSHDASKNETNAKPTSRPSTPPDKHADYGRYRRAELREGYPYVITDRGDLWRLSINIDGHPVMMLVARHLEYAQDERAIIAAHALPMAYG